jgi:hypothetical protein
MLLPATLTTFYYSMPIWVSLTFSIFTGITVVIYLTAYVYLLRFDRDSVRSESYLLQKLAIEKGVYGDNITGTVEEAVLEKALLVSPEGSDPSQKK